MTDKANESTQTLSPHYILIGDSTGSQDYLAIGYTEFLHVDLRKKNGMRPHGNDSLIQRLAENVGLGEKEIQLRFGKNKAKLFLALKETMADSVLVLTAGYGTLMSYETLLFPGGVDPGAAGEKFCRQLLRLVNNPSEPTMVRVGVADLDNLDQIMTTAREKRRLDRSLPRMEGQKRTEGKSLRI